MLVQRDRDILNFVYDNGGITIYQCAKMFFNDSKHSYTLARKRLKKIYEMGLLKYTTHKLSNERVYCMDKKLGDHAIFLLNVYATFVESGCKILEFNKEPRWMVSDEHPQGKYRSDGFFKVEYNGKKRIYCVEIDITHPTNVEKYEDIFNSKEIQNKYGGFPMIIVVGETLVPYHSKNFDCAYLDFKLNGFAEQVLAL
jgi:hypothetical protein